MLIKPSWHSWTKVVTGLDLVSLCSLWFKVIPAIHHDPAKAIGNKGTDTFLRVTLCPCQTGKINPKPMLLKSVKKIQI